MIFDQYSRYEACARLLGAAGYRRGKRVLDVGSGPEALFGRCLREEDVTYLDPLIAPGATGRHVNGDVFSADLGRRRFSYVTAVDVFEHVPADRRNAFLGRIMELADEGFVLGFPSSDNPPSAETDQLIDDKYRAIFGHDYPWLAEHFENGLPSVEETCSALARAGWHCQVVGHGRVDWLVRLLSFSICIWDIDFLKKVVLVASERFNRELAEHDFEAPFYRTFIVATRAPLSEPLLLTPSRPDLDVGRVFEEILDDAQDKFAAEVLRHMQSQEFELAKTSRKALEISDWAVGLKAMVDEKTIALEGAERQLQAKDHQLAAANAKVQEVSDWAVGLKTKADEKLGALEAAERRLQARDDELAAASARIQEISDREAELKRTLDDRSAQLEDAERRLIESSESFAKVNGENQALTEQVLVLKGLVADKALRIEELERGLVEKTDECIGVSSRLHEISSLLPDLRADIALRDGQLAEAGQSLANARARVHQLEDNVKVMSQALSDGKAREEALRHDLEVLRHREAGLQAQLMELSSWATRIHSRPLEYAWRKHAHGVARATLRALPVTISTKQRLRDSFLSLTRPFRARAVGACARPAMELAQDVKRLNLPSTGLRGRDVFVFSVIDWHFRIQRPQHMARSLAEAGQRVFYFSNHFVDADEPGYQIERLSPLHQLYQIKLNVKGAPAIYFAPPTPEAEVMLEQSISRVILDFGAIGTISIIQHAYWYPLVTRLPNNFRVYDCMDHHEGFGNVPERLVEIEKAMLSGSDLVTVTSSWLESFAREYNSNVAVVRNAAEYSHFASVPEPVYSDPAGRRIIGYYGAIAEWFDLDLLRAIAERFSDCLVLVVGDDTVGARATLADLSNVIFTGEVPYAELPYYLYAFDVCLLPFKVIPLTLATNPVKVYEYLAAGKPVVCVDLPEIAQFGDLVWRAGSHGEFLQHVGQALDASSSAAPLVASRQAFSAEQTWVHRAEEFSAALEGVRPPRISVIILTYNNLELTKACLQSVVERSDYPDLEIVIVDNASSDGSPAYLREFGEAHPNVKVILNDSNLGFAAGNNVGMAAATGDYLVLLNNDTVVTRGWVMTMLRHLEADSSLGIIGPRTNNIGNEARVEMHYKDVAEMPAEALQLTLGSMGKVYPMRNAAFFCAMLPRSTYELCGPISEDYGRGFFEDDDYCRKVEAVGLRVVCADDVFVHHHLSASFSKLKDAERQALFERNKAVYEQKWGAWEPHVYRP